MKKQFGIAIAYPLAILLNSGSLEPVRAQFPPVTTTLNGFNAALQGRDFFTIGREHLERQIIRNQLFHNPQAKDILDIAPEVSLQDEEIKQLEQTPQERGEGSTTLSQPHQLH